MSFMDAAIADSMDIWRKCADEKFLIELAEDTLSREKFLDYIIQDSIYLRGYLKGFAYAIIKCRTLRDMQLYYSLLGYVNDGENATRLAYLSEHGLTDADIDKFPARKQCRDYVDFINTVGQNGTEEDILMASLPCMLGYHYVFSELKRRFSGKISEYYAPLISDYTSEGYDKNCKKWIAIANEKCSRFDQRRRTELIEVFRQGSLHELYFWQMAGEER